MATVRDESRLFRFTVPPRAFSTLALQMRPHAVCTISPAWILDHHQPIELHADSLGIIRLQVRPSRELDEAIGFFIDCEADGKTTRHQLHLWPSFKPTEHMPMPDDDVKAHHGPDMRPGLSEAEMTSMTDRDLLERGYPRRPSRREVPWAFSSWCNIVENPMTVVEPALMERKDTRAPKAIRHATGAVTPNWCGFGRQLFGRGPDTLDDHYDWVRGSWAVPMATGEGGNRFGAQAALWVGLDGLDVDDLWQAGTTTKAVVYGYQGAWFVEVGITWAVAWTEFLPQQEYSVEIANFPVVPGDDVFVEVWIGNAGSQPTLSGNFGVALVWNLTRQVSTTIYTPVGGTRLVGYDAVWIMERPQAAPFGGIFGSARPYWALANYGSATLHRALARTVSGKEVPYLGIASRQFTMANDEGGVLSTATSVDISTMRFDWKAFS